MGIHIACATPIIVQRRLILNAKEYKSSVYETTTEEDLGQEAYHIEDARIISRNPIIQVIITIRRQLILTRADAICVVRARTLDPDVNVIGRARGAKTVENDEFLEIGCITNLALLEVATRLERGGEWIVESAVTAGYTTTVGAVRVLAVVGSGRAVATSIIAVVWVAKERKLG